MPVRKKAPEDLTAKKALALEVIDRLKKRISRCRLYIGL